MTLELLIRSELSLVAVMVTGNAVAYRHTFKQLVRANAKAVAEETADEAVNVDLAFGSFLNMEPRPFADMKDVASNASPVELLKIIYRVEASSRFGAYLGSSAFDAVEEARFAAIKRLPGWEG
jgi:hypothetical protein